jgi:signal transduction histidine kinase
VKADRRSAAKPALIAVPPAAARDRRWWIGDDPADDRRLARRSVSDIRLVRAASALSFIQNGERCEVILDPESAATLQLLSARPAVIAELRVIGTGRNAAFLFAASGQTRPGQWEVGELLALPDRRAPDTSAALPMLLGDMADVLADLRHDLRQPLAAIGLAAHNGRRMIDRGMIAEASAKFDTILDHIDACERTMAGRTPGLVYAETIDAVVPFVATVRAAASAARRRLADAGILLSVIAKDSDATVRIQPEALDCLVALALRRAAEAIGDDPSRAIELAMSDEGGQPTIIVQHRGAPLDDGSLAAAMMRKILARAGGGMECRAALDRTTTILTLPGLSATIAGNDDTAAPAPSRSSFMDG